MNISNIAKTATLCVVALLVLSMSATAQAPQIPLKMNYQVMLTDDADQPLANQTLGAMFRIYDVATGGPSLWAEGQNITTNSVGVASVILGTTNPLNISFNRPLWLEIEVEGEILTPRRELVAVPYALHAETATYALIGGPADTAQYAYTAGFADTAGYALAAPPCDTCAYADTAAYAVTAGYADTAAYALAAPPCDTCAYAVAAGSAGDADSLGGHAAMEYVLGDSLTLFADAYALKVDLSTPGTINDTTNLVDWTKLKSVPAGFADGTDDVGGGAGYYLDADDGDPTEAVYVDSVGNVGVGTTMPVYRVDVHSAGGSVVGLYDHEGAGGAIDLLTADVRDVHTTLQPDIDGGGGYFEVGAPDGGLIVDGNDEADGSMAVYLDGAGSSIEFDAGETGNDSVQLPNDAVNSAELLDEPGVACYYTGAGLGMTGLYQPVVSQSIVAPGPGYAFVMATGQANCTHDTTEVARLFFGVSPDSTILAEGLDEEIQLPTELNAGAYKFAFAPAAVFPIDDAGTYTYYLTASASGTWYIYDTTISVIYFPTAYGSVPEYAATPSAAASDADAVSNASTVASRVADAEAMDGARVERELAQMEARIAELRARIERSNNR